MNVIKSDLYELGNKMNIEKFKQLLSSMGKCEKCLNLKGSNEKDRSLINIFQNHDFCKNIPSIWTDWFNRLDSKIMIIGQDWGPYNDMKKLNELLKNDKSNWKELIEYEKSNTKKLLESYIKESSNNKYSLNDIFITNAIMCARKGNNYRGDNINLKKSTNNCSGYLLNQIDIVKPKVILTLGYYPLLSLSTLYGFNIEKNLKETIHLYPEIHIKDFVIIPLFHPVAQIKKIEQLEQYKRIWKYID